MLTSRFGAIPSREPPPSRSPGLRRRPGRWATDDRLRRPGGLGHPRASSRRPRDRGPGGSEGGGRASSPGGTAGGVERGGGTRQGRARRLATARGPLRDGAGRATGPRRPAGGRGNPSGCHPRGPRQPARCAADPAVGRRVLPPGRGPRVERGLQPDGRTLAAGCSDGRQGGLVLLCDPSRSTETPLPTPEGGVRAVAFSPTERPSPRGPAAGWPSGTWSGGPDLAKGRWISRGTRSRAQAFSPTERPSPPEAGVGSCSGTSHRRVRLGELPRLMDNEYHVASLAFSPDGKTLLTVSGGEIALWDAASRQPISEPFGDLDQAIECAAFSPTARPCAAGLEGVDVDVCAGVALWDMEGRHRLFEQPLAVAGNRVTSVVFGSRMLAAGVDDRVVLWDLTRRPPLADRPQVIAGASGHGPGPQPRRQEAGRRLPPPRRRGGDLGPRGTFATRGSAPAHRCRRPRRGVQARRLDHRRGLRSGLEGAGWRTLGRPPSHATRRRVPGDRRGFTQQRGLQPGWHGPRRRVHVERI